MQTVMTLISVLWGYFSNLNVTKLLYNYFNYYITEFSSIPSCIIINDMQSKNPLQRYNIKFWLKRQQRIL
jgi:hypothetical protein